MTRTRLSLRAELLRGAALLLAAPMFLAAAVVIAWPAKPGRILLAATFALLLACAVLFAWYMASLVRRRIDVPLASFLSTLEDISEGFIVERIPMDIFGTAESDITESFRKVIQINRMLLKTVDHLEQGFEEERQAKLQQLALTRAYQRFVPQEFINFLQKESVTGVRLGDHIQTDMTILVSDIRQFTALSERLTPEQNFALINDYLYEMEPIVKEHHGFIDKFMGDAIMALFHGSADNALQAALGMLRRLKRFNDARGARGAEPLHIGIGLNTGPMMLGIVGGENRMEGTVISDAVNAASRIEDLNKLYGTSLLLSEHTYGELGNPASYDLRIIDRVQIRGKSQTIQIYEAFDADDEEVRRGKLRTKELFEEAWRFYEAGRVADAAVRFARCEELDPLDPVPRIYRQRCRERLNETAGGEPMPRQTIHKEGGAPHERGSTD